MTPGQAFAWAGLVVLALWMAPHAAALLAVQAEQGHVDLPGTAPVAGSDVTASSTARLRFNNTGSDEAAVWTYTVSVSFTPDANGVPGPGPIAFQGRSMALTDLVSATVGAASAGSTYTPMQLVTAQDLSGEAGWTAAASCDVVSYQGRFSVASFAEDGTQRPATDRYYQVCDNGTRIYVGASQDLSTADHAYLLGHAVANTTAEDWQVDIEGNPYVFTSAASATDVALRLGHHVGAGPEAVDVGLLVSFPQGFPAGQHTSTVTVDSRAVAA